MLIDYKAKVGADSRLDHIGFRVLSGRAPGNEIVIRPGVQEIDAEAWKRVRDGAAIGFDAETKLYGGPLVESGAIRILEDDSLGEKSPKRFDVAKLTPSDVRDLVERTTVPAILTGWKSALASKTGSLWEQVHKDLDAQITAVTTDANGQPATQREVTLPKTAHGA